MSLLIACNGGETSVDLSEGLVAHYLLNNNADDSYGTYNGIDGGGSIDYKGDITYFNGGIDSHVDIPDNMIEDSNPFLISCWISMNSTQTDPNSRFISIFGATTNIQVGAYTTGKVYIRANDVAYTTDIGTFSMGVLTHFVFMFDGTNYFTFINGVPTTVTLDEAPSANATFSALASGYVTGDYALAGYSEILEYTMKPKIKNS